MTHQNQNQPNLFSYATSELSQDAFICWLAAWADPKWRDANPALHQVGRDFVASMIRKVKSEYDSVSIKTVDVSRQVEKLDVLIEVNKGSDDKLAILVEDKTHTSNHSDQLNRYHEQVNKDYQLSEMIPLYFKTGYQSKFDTLGFFKTYLRSDFLTVLRSGKARGVQNAIFDDFLTHLEQMDAAIRQFSNKALDNWDPLDWQGFFMVLYDKRLALSKTGIDDNWGYVANPSGGFWGYWWNFKVSAEGGYWSYLQLEGDKLCYKLCYKIGFSEEVCKSEDWRGQAQKIKSLWSSLILKLDEESTAKNTKIGKTMTIVRKADDCGVLVPNTDGMLNLDKTIIQLLKAQEVLQQVRQQINSTYL